MMIRQKIIMFIGLAWLSSLNAQEQPRFDYQLSSDDYDWLRYCWEEQPSTQLRLSNSLQALYTQYNRKHPDAPLYPYIKILHETNFETQTLTFYPLAIKHELPASTKLVLICLPTGDSNDDIKLLMERTMPFMTPITIIYYSQQTGNLYLTEDEGPEVTAAQAMDVS